eukprot:164336_1
MITQKAKSAATRGSPIKPIIELDSKIKQYKFVLLDTKTKRKHLMYQSITADELAKDYEISTEFQCLDLALDLFNIYWPIYRQKQQLLQLFGLTANHDGHFESRLIPVPSTAFQKLFKIAQKMVDEKRKDFMEFLTSNSCNSVDEGVLLIAPNKQTNEFEAFVKFGYRDLNQHVYFKLYPLIEERVEEP